MSVKDERDLRESLAGLLDGVTPRPAPVAGAVHRGRRIRLRRWVSVAAAVAVIAAGAAIAPALLRSQSPGPVSPTHHNVPHFNVTLLPDSADTGHVIAAGITDGRHWKVIASGSSNAAVQVTGRVGLGTWDSGPGPASWPVNFQWEGTNGARGFVSLVGTVTADVTTIVMKMPRGVTLTLRPVSYHGARWVAVVLPGDVPIIRALAYSGGRELAYSVPFRESQLDLWLKPGQHGAARVTRKLGSGVVDGLKWQVTAEIGPWGYCYVYSAGDNFCLDSASDPQRVSAAKPVSVLNFSSLGANPNKGPWEAEVGVASDVRRVRLSYSDGSSASFAAVSVGADRVVAFTVPKRASVVAAIEYGAAGEVVGKPRATLWPPHFST